MSEDFALYEYREFRLANLEYLVLSIVFARGTLAICQQIGFEVAYIKKIWFI
jgi:hypothetical protein